MYLSIMQTPVSWKNKIYSPRDLGYEASSIKNS